MNKPDTYDAVVDSLPRVLLILGACLLFVSLFIGRAALRDDVAGLHLWVAETRKALVAMEKYYMDRIAIVEVSRREIFELHEDLREHIHQRELSDEAP